MEKITRSALVMYSAEQMYALVDDISSYPQFVPNCTETHILSEENNVVCASLQVAKSGVAKTFSTRNTRTLNQRIQMQLLDGPFNYLQGDWTFHALNEQACKIELELEFEFSSRLASMAFNRIFNQLVQSMVGAFSERAKSIYG